MKFEIFKHKHDQRHFITNVCVGILIAVIFTILGDTWWGEDKENSGLDVLARLENRLYRDKSVDLAKSPVYFIEITHADHKRWGSPDVTPRDRLARMVECARERKAKVIVLDVLLEKKGNKAADTKLRDVLERMLAEQATTAERAKNHVIFPVTVTFDGNIRTNIFDDLIDGEKNRRLGIFHRGSPTIEATATDKLNRYWSVYKPGLNSKSKLEVVWSVPLLAAAIREGKEEELRNISLDLLHHEGGHGGHGAGIVLGGRHVEIPSLERIPPPANGYVAGSAVGYQAGTAHSAIYTQRIRFRLEPDKSSTARLKLTADKFEDNRQNLLPDLTGKVVLIGNLSPDTGDIHYTPVGTLPGVYILGNAVNAIASGLQPVHMYRWLHYMIEGVIIIIAAFLFLRFPSIVAQIVATVVFFVIFFPVSWLTYEKWGLFFNFVLPVTGMGLHRIFSDLEVSLAQRGKKHESHQTNSELHSR